MLPSIISTSKIITGQHQNKETIIFIPGFTGDDESFSKLDYKFANEFSQIICVKNIGVNSYDLEPQLFTIDVMSKMIIEYIEKNKLDTKGVILIGHSMGGAIAQYIARKLGDVVHKLILISTFAKADTVCMRNLNARLMLSNDSIDKSDAFDIFSPTLFANEYLDNEESMHISKSRFVNNNIMHKGMLGQYNAIMKFNSSSWLNNINHKTLIVTGSEDILVSPHHSIYLSNNIKNSIIEFIPNCGHMVQFEKPKILYNHIKNFIL